MSDFLRDISARVGLTIDDGGLESFNKKLEGMHRSLEIVAGAEILKGLFEIAERFSGMGEELETAAASAGITTTAFQELAFAASQSGVSQEKLGVGLTMLSRQIEAAREGSEGAAAVFGKLGISPEQLAGFKDSEEALKAVADRISQIEDPIKRTQAAMKIFGRGGAQMVRFLTQGSRGIGEDMEKASRIGAVVGTEQIEQLARLEDSLSAFGKIVKAAFAVVATYAAPIIEHFVDQLEKLWMANRKVIQTNVKKWIGDLAYGLGYVGGFVRGLIKSFMEFGRTFPLLTKYFGEVALAAVMTSAAFSAFGTLFGGLKSALGVLSGAFTALNISVFASRKVMQGLWFVLGGGKQLLISLGLRIATLAETAFPLLSDAVLAFSSMLEATPLGVVVASIGLMVVAVHDLWKVFQGGDFWKDTWLGQGISAIEKFINGTYKQITGKNYFTSMMTDDEKAQAARAEARANPNAQGRRNKFGQLLDETKLANGLPMPKLLNLPGANNPLYDTTQNQAVSFQNTFNITSPAGADANSLVATIKEQFDKSHTLMMQQAKDVLVKPRIM